MPEIPAFVAKLEALIREAEQAGADLVLESAKAKVPYDEHTKHHVRDALHTEETEDGVLVVAGDHDVFYAHMVEHGTTHSPPHPFLVPALEENGAAIIGLVAEAVRKAAL